MAFPDSPNNGPAPGAQRARLDALLRDSPACLASLAGPDHMVTVANQLFRQLFGNRPMAGLPLRTALPELADEVFFGLLDAVYATGTVCHGREEVTFRASAHPDLRRPVHFTFIAQAVRDGAGAVEGLLLFVYDVSAHAQARQQATARVGQPLAATLELASLELGTANLQLATTLEVLSVTNAELDATNDQLTESNADLARANADLKAGNDDMRAHVRELRHAQQALRALNAKLEARVAERTDQLQAALREAERANAAMLASNRQLLATNADLDSFVYAASHDLKLPVLNLAGLFEELRRGVVFTDPAEEGILVPLIEQTLGQLTGTLRDLAALGQLESAAPAEPLALAAVVQEVLQGLEPQQRAARARVTVDFAVRPVVAYPRAALRTIVLNLLSNAFKYADPARPCRVHVSLVLDAGQPVLIVGDNGLGFDADAHGAELFQLFRRFHDHTEGTGVGLYLVNRLVQANGGHLAVDSRVGEGATFRAYLGGREEGRT